MGVKYYAVVDCDNCFVSCERVFRPDLEGKVVVVLSNNDGCVVSRSNEAKKLGIKMGAPYFKLAQEFPDEKIEAFSGNYELYGNLTGRVMNLVRKKAVDFYRYSIDEAFVTLPPLPPEEMKKWGEELHAMILKQVGIPVSVGIATSKTLAKIASHFAKKYAGYRHCCLIDNEEKRLKALQLTPIGDVWGIGRRYGERLRGLAITTAEAFYNRKEEWVRSNFNVVILRTYKELHGEDCIANEEPAKKQSICFSRSFPSNIEELEMLRPYITNFAVQCAQKLRKQQSAATQVGVFLITNRFREDLPQYGGYKEWRFLTPVDSTLTLVEKATQCLEQAYRKGYAYKRAGVMVTTTDTLEGVQTNLIDYDPEHYEKMKRLDAVVDKVNRIAGKETITLGGQFFGATEGGKSSTLLQSAIRREHVSPNYTTRWGDIIEVR